MTESAKHISKKAGLPPGSLIHVGKRKTEKIKISVIDYNQDDYKHVICKNTDECFPYKKTKTVSWINVDGLHETDIIASIGNNFELHPLLIEDVLNTKHRPKIEVFDNHVFLTLKMLGIGEDQKLLISEQISFVLGKGWLLSFQEKEGDIFDGLRLRLQENKGNFRQKDTDYLFYRLIDTVVDNYFFIIEHLGEVIENLEEEVIQSPTPESLNEIHEIKKQLVKIRRVTFPLREAVSNLQKDAAGFINPATIHYLRDVYEHVIQINDTIETQRDMVASIMELYLTSVSNKTNQVMQLLTIISTIFIPLTFIAGIYGMNFENMPEIHWKYGYIVVWILMVIIVLFMLRFFKRKKWL